MNKKLSPYFISLTQDACLRAFWRKSTLKNFLAQMGIKEQFLLSWDENETKQVFLSKVFSKLSTHKEMVGHQTILRIAESLIEMKSFPDLHGWNDSAEKISNAAKAIERLKFEYSKIKTELSSEEKKRRTKEKLAKVQFHEQSLSEFSNQLLLLMDKIGTQKAGYDFEKWFYDFLIFNDIPATPSYKDKNGRQIDGAFTVDGVTYLLETKFTKGRIESPDIDIFDAKIRKKADNTMGMMVSINGFVAEAIQTASCDRSVMILMDGTHLFNLIFTQQLSLKELIQNIAMHASRTGNAYISVSELRGF